MIATVTVVVCVFAIPMLLAWAFVPFESLGGCANDRVVNRPDPPPAPPPPPPLPPRRVMQGAGQ